MTDNGVGFDQKIESRSTLGIETCKQRAKIIDYTFTIASQLNQGTTITLLEN